ncbi:MAG: nitrous oxide reductase accessory protein NosL [Caldimonas sp.]
MAALLAAVIAGGCGRPSPPPAAPPPVEVQADSAAHFCGMLLVDHEGPKGQIHLASSDKTVWFSSVRDTIAFTRLPEEARDITAIYVNDMGRARSWARPEPGTWVDAKQAWFVIDSDMRGGMGAPEAVPFSQKTAAEAFRGIHQGRIVRMADIPGAYVLGRVDMPGGAANAPASAPASSPVNATVPMPAPHAPASRGSS